MKGRNCECVRGWMRSHGASCLSHTFAAPTMQPLSPSVRMHNLSLLDSEQFDVLVIGGGITGAGVALDAVARGYKVALVEKPDFDFALVHEALVERGILVHTAPFLVHPVPFVLPMYKGDLHPVGMPFTTP